MRIYTWRVAFANHSARLRTCQPAHRLHLTIMRCYGPVRQRRPWWLAFGCDSLDLHSCELYSYMHKMSLRWAYVHEHAWLMVTSFLIKIAHDCHEVTFDMPHAAYHDWLARYWSYTQLYDRTAIEAAELQRFHSIHTCVENRAKHVRTDKASMKGCMLAVDTDVIDHRIGPQCQCKVRGSGFKAGWTCTHKCRHWHKGYATETIPSSAPTTDKQSLHDMLWKI